MCTFIILTMLFILYAGAVVSGEVQQTPSHFFKSVGKSVKFNCQHAVPNYNVILWYRQGAGRGLTLLGNLVLTNGNVEKDFNGEIQIQGDANTNKANALIINSLSPTDSAVYFCAAYRHSAAGCQTSCAKTHFCASLIHTCSTIPLTICLYSCSAYGGMQQTKLHYEMKLFSE